MDVTKLLGLFDALKDDITNSGSNSFQLNVRGSSNNIIGTLYYSGGGYPKVYYTAVDNGMSRIRERLDDLEYEKANYASARSSLIDEKNKLKTVIQEYKDKLSEIKEEKKELKEKVEELSEMNIFSTG